MCGCCLCLGWLMLFCVRCWLVGLLFNSVVCLPGILDDLFLFLVWVVDTLCCSLVAFFGLGV